MTHVRDLWLKHLSDRRYVYVFPSEVAASWALLRLLEESGADVIPRTKCVSWDSFKERTLSPPSGARPVDQVSRTLFLHALLEENAGHPFFSALVNPAFARDSSTSLRSLRRALPFLTQSAPLWAGAGTGLAPGKTRDLERLFSRYGRFLEEAGLYEPDAPTAAFNPEGKTYLIFHPEVIADWERVSPAWRGHPAVQSVTAPPGAGAPAGITAHPDLETEINRTMRRIHALLEAGTLSSGIAVTAAGLAEFAPALEDGARRYDIRLRITEGTPLLNRPGVSFLARAADVAASRFGLRELEAWLADPALPWRADLPADALIRFGLEHNCVCNYTESGRPFDLWEHRFRRAIAAGGRAAAGLKPVAAFYRSLRTHLAGLTGAASFAELKKAVTAFRAVWLTGTFPDQAAALSFDLALRRLDELQERSRTLPLPPPARPFALWLDLLRETPYVTPARGPGIAVYPYRVSAGITPDHHFVINACEELTRVIIRPFPFLSVDEEARLGLAEADLSDAFLRLYRASGAAVSLSFSRQSGGQVRLPPPFFVKTGEVQEAAPETTDAYREEELFFQNAGGPTPTTLFSLQRSGLINAAVVSPLDPAALFTLSPVTPRALLDRVRAKLTDRDGNIALTPSGLETFQACAFRYLLEQAAGLKKSENALAQDDRRWYGTFIHRVLERFLGGLRTANERFSPSRLPRYREYLREAAEQEEAAWETAGRLPVPPLWRALRQDLEPRFGAFLEETALVFGEFEILQTEWTADRLWKKERTTLSGKIDLFIRTEDGPVLIDYKTRNAPGRSEIAPPAGAPSSFQIPCYLLLAEQETAGAIDASYYSFERETYIHVCRPRAKKYYFTAEEMAAVTDLTQRIILMTAEKIGAGDFSDRGTAADRCHGCPLRPICRRQYHLLVRE